MRTELGKNTPLPLTGSNVEDTSKLLAALYELQSYQNYMLRTGRFGNGQICQYDVTDGQILKIWNEPIIQGRDEWEVHMYLDPLFKRYRDEIAKIVHPEKGGPIVKIGENLLGWISTIK